MIDRETLQQNGFFYFDICTSVEIEKLKMLYSETQRKNETNGMFVSHNSGDSETALKVSEDIHQVLISDMQKLFPDYDYFLGHFAVKSKHTFHNFDLHRDWNLVDESVHHSIQIWIPLSISYPENGGMCFIPRSQLFNNTPRSGSLRIPFIKIEQDLHPYLTYTRLHPGQAVCFYTNTFHGSFSNPTDEDRVAVLINLIPKNATTAYFHYNENKQTLQTYSITAEKLIRSLPWLEKGEAPSTELIDEMPLNNFEKLGTVSKEKTIEWIKYDRSIKNLFPEYEFKQTNIFKNSEIEKDINRQGFTVIQLLTAPEIESLQKLFKHYFPDSSLYSGRYNSIDNIPIDKSLEAHLAITEIIQHRMDKYFKDYISPISVFYGKRNDGVNDTDWHTDPSHVFNNHLESYYGAWCPFIDVDDLHGVLNVVPVSHRLLNRLISPVFPWPLKNKRRMLDNYRKNFSLKAGEAILFDARLIHSSQPNISDIERTGIVVRIAHKDTKYIGISPSEKENTVVISKQDKDFFFDEAIHKHFQKPKGGTFSGKLNIFPYPISDEEIKHKLFTHFQSHNSSIFE